MHTTIRTSLLLLAATILCSAATITFVGTQSTINDGSAVVGPYILTVDGQTVLGVCIDSNLEVGPPYTWSGNIDPISDFSQPRRTTLEEQVWLAEQFAVQPEDDWAQIHHAIWDLTGATYSDAGTWLSLAASNYGMVDVNNWDLIVPNPEDFTQSFLVDAVTVAAPEPGPVYMVAAGLALLVGVRLWKKRTKKVKHWRRNILDAI